MCDCFKFTQSANNSTTIIYDHNECGGITVDLLRMYLNPVICYLNNKLWAKVQSSEEELQNVQLYLETFIAAKIADPETCEYRDQLPPVQLIINRIISKGICL